LTISLSGMRLIVNVATRFLIIFRSVHVPLVISAAGLGIGIRQWFILSKWTKKYDRYKKLQEQVNKKLDDSNNGQN